MNAGDRQRPPAAGPERGAFMGAFQRARNKKAPTVALTDSAIRALRPREKAYKVADDKGLYLQVTPSGGRLWRVKFRAEGGIEKKLSLGSYPDVSLRAARAARDNARSL